MFYNISKLLYVLEQQDFMSFTVSCCGWKEFVMRPCPYCGHEVPKSERYCPNCGRIRKAPISLDKYSLGMIENFKQCFIYKYADFEGRASRSEYWNFFLVYQLLFVAILFTCAFLSYISPLSSAVGVGVGLVILVLISVVMVIPSVAVAVRRLHDQGRSGGIVFIGLVPVIGTIVLLALMALPGENHTNRFGSPTGQVILTKQMAHEIGLIDATPTTGLTAGLLCAIFVLWFLVDRLLTTSVM